MVADEVEGVLGVDIPLVLTHLPISAPLGNIRLADQCVFGHFACASIHCEWRTWIGAKLTHLVDDDTVVVQHDDVVAVKPRHLAFDVRRLVQLRRSQCVHDNEHIVGLDHPFQ